MIFGPKFLCANSISGVKSCWTPGTFAAEPVAVGQLVGVAVQAELVKRHITQLHLEWRCENRRPTVLQENIFLARRQVRSEGVHQVWLVRKWNS